MIVFVSFLLFSVYLYSLFDRFWVVRSGVIFCLSSLVYLLPSFYSQLYGDEVSQKVFILYFLFFIAYIPVYLSLMLIFKSNVSINLKALPVSFNCSRGKRYSPYFVLVSFIVYLAFILNADLFKFILMSHHEQVSLINQDNRTSIDLFLFSIMMITSHTLKGFFTKHDYISGLLFFILIITVFGRNPSLLYMLGFFVALFFYKLKTISFKKVIVLSFVGCFFMGAINAKRAVGFDIFEMYEHVRQHGFIGYIFGTEFNVPARILYFMINDANGREAFQYPGYSLFVVTLNSFFPSAIWERLPTASMTLSRLYATTGGLPLIIEFFGNFGMKLLLPCGAIMGLISFYVDSAIAKLFRYNFSFSITISASLMFVAINSHRIDFAISLKMFVVAIVLSLFCQAFLKKVP